MASQLTPAMQRLLCESSCGPDGVLALRSLGLGPDGPSVQALLRRKLITWRGTRYLLTSAGHSHRRRALARRTAAAEHRQL
jgi:hypothetical protein